MNMNILFIFITFIVTIKMVHSGPTPTTNVYKKLIELPEKDGYKCPYLRKTLLLDSQQLVFLQASKNFAEEINITDIMDFNEPQALCMLFYKNFKDLCHITDKNDEQLLKPFNMENIVHKYSADIKVVCANIDRFSNKTELPEEPITKPLYKLFSDPNKCAKVCTGLDDKVKPACALSSYMAFIGSQMKPKIVSQTKPLLTKSADINSNEQHAAKPKQTNEVVIKNVQPIKAETDVDVNANVKNPTTSTELVTQKTSNGPLIDQVYSAEGLANADAPNSQPNSQLNEQNTDGNIKQDESPKVDSKELVNPEPTAPTVTEVNSNRSAPKSPAQSSEPNTRQQENAEPHANVVQSQPNKPVIPIHVDLPTIQQQNPSTSQEKIETIPQPIDSAASPQKPVEEMPILPPVSKASSAESSQPALPIPVDNNNNDIKIEETIPKKDVVDTNQEYVEDEDEEEYPIPESAKAKVAEKSKPRETDEDSINFSATYPNQSMNEDDSYFFSYFMMVCIVFILGYVGYHNKQKLLALVLEGRKGRRQQRRRPNSANYHKLDSNLEEAVTSSCNKNTTNVIY